MKRLLFVLLALSSSFAGAERLPAAERFYYCAELFRYYEKVLRTDRSPLAEEMRAYTDAFDEYSADFTNGSLDLDAHRLEAHRFYADLKMVIELPDKKEQFETLNSKREECKNLIMNNLDVLKARNQRVRQYVKVYSFHSLQPGVVSAEAIEKRKEQIASHSDGKRSDGRDVTWYVFTRRIGVVEREYAHGFVKEGHAAYPAVIFRATIRRADEKLPIFSQVGSYAGPKHEFFALYYSDSLSALVVHAALGDK